MRKRLNKNRLIALSIVFTALYLWAASKLVFLIVHSEQFHSTNGSVKQIRNKIVDKNNYILAYTKPTVSLYLDPSRFPEAFDPWLGANFPEAASRLPDLRRRGSKFIWLDRHSGRLEEVKKLRIPGIHSRDDYERIYPFHKFTSILLGFCDVDGNGQAGIEYLLNNRIQHEAVKLSIDIVKQKMLHEIMFQAVEHYEADGGSGIIIELDTGNIGRIRAMVSFPVPLLKSDFLLNQNRNRNFDQVEVGSVLKLLNVAQALESGKYRADTLVDARGPLKIGDFEINDFFGANRMITVSESLWRSSNIANARIALRLGKKMQREYYKKLGLLDQVEYLPGCRLSPILPKKWRKSTTATLAYGYGVGITTLHLAKAILSIVTGFESALSMLEDEIPKHHSGKRLFSKSTVETIKQLMQQVVQNNLKSTLNIPGYSIGAKTGTANLLVNGKYEQGKNFVTLATVAPLENPKFLIILQMTNPKKDRLLRGNYTTAGNVLSIYMKLVLKNIIAMEAIQISQKNPSRG